jgi:hypothetical protein
MIFAMSAEKARRKQACVPLRERPTPRAVPQSEDQPIARSCEPCMVSRHGAPAKELVCRSIARDHHFVPQSYLAGFTSPTLEPLTAAYACTISRPSGSSGRTEERCLRGRFQSDQRRWAPTRCTGESIRRNRRERRRCNPRDLQIRVSDRRAPEAEIPRIVAPN